MQLKFLTASHPKSTLPFSGVIMKHELSSMKAFVILAESSSFNNAAKLLNITQPALTRRIKKMEEDLHIQLFERTTRKVTLTKAGKRLLPEAKACIRNWLDYDRMFFVVVGDAASQLDRIRKSGLGEVKVVDLQELR